ncbi:MAG: hypothetical protein J0H73_13920 [Salana multivorans]|uniref:DUF7426 family protein n=1 Tax=Salana multivorans TaxID=120377 RepID=UPI000959F1E9|nr:hypothetical protein [Salana multivorans]MBN8883398.1 hypothetical protein [Salana multivorans]OJX94087.1 MAG: hypothetical protein BGO96_09785 [Micrococcales bacterium 73-15]
MPFSPDWLTPALLLPYGDTVYEAPPPSKEVGIQLAAVNALGIATYASVMEACPTCGRSGAPDVPASTLATIESIGEAEIARLSLGPAYDAMIADDVPGPHIDQMGVYALYYWTLGEETADKIMAGMHGGDAAGEARSGSSTSKRGPRTASATRTQRRASTRTTGASRTL